MYYKSPTPAGNVGRKGDKRRMKHKSAFDRKMAARRRHKMFLDVVGATLCGASTTFVVYVVGSYLVARFGGAL